MPSRFITWAHAVRAALATAAALMAAACAIPEPARQPAVAVAAAEPTPLPTAISARGKYILVDIPAFELIAFEDGAPALHSRVIVGRPQTPTPQLVTSMYAITFNPSWTPTPAMVRNEGLRFVPPGPNNPLGRILFKLANDQLIFLHDTNQKDLFNRAQRALSHGCVRVEQARPLAAWALGVTVGDIDAMIALGTTTAVRLPESIPVALAHPTQAARQPAGQRIAVGEPATAGCPA